MWAIDERDRITSVGNRRIYYGVIPKVWVIDEINPGKSVGNRRIKDALNYGFKTPSVGNRRVDLDGKCG